MVTAYDGGELTVQVKLHDTRGKTATRFLAPVVTPYPTWDERTLFLSLDQKMLVVPYDNDMWSRYESAVPACGRESYDVTALYDERTQEGFVLGALDFSVWKNAIRWLHNDARSIQAYCGAAGTGTHDVCPHGLVCGEWVESSRFVMFWCDSHRDGMEHYGDLYAALVPPRRGGKVQSRSDGTAILLWGRGCNCLIGNRQGNLSVPPCRTSAGNRGKHSSTWMVRWGWMSKKSGRL